ncbi:MAG: viscotoxin-A3 [Gordonibacter sp.]|uniref:viscotoxin-A3 n=1 Tax=Gordonibacter sp. TaxID=1968902 RepID=UPI00321FB743
MPAGLTDEQIANEERFLEGIPRLNIGALFLPPIWGPAHGFWASILFYPVWLFADNTFYAAWTERTPLAIIVATVVFVSLTAGTVAFSLIGQPFAAHRAASRGVGKEAYLKRQRIWAMVSVAVGLVMIAAAAYYNLAIRPTVGLA